MNLHDTLPQLSGAIHLNGLQAQVDVLRDRWGIPHIRAHAAHDAFMAQGFVHAQDRLWQMEWDRRRAYGTTAELLGRSRVDADRLARRLQIERAAKADWDILNAETRAMLDAYAAGVNAFVQRFSPRQYPSVEFEILDLRPEPWRPWDCLSLFKIHHALMGLMYNKLWRLKVLLSLGVERGASLFPGYPDDHPVIVPSDAIYQRGVKREWPTLQEAARLLPGVGESNNWVVDGRKTQSGKPLLAGDPHRAIDVPNVFYQNHLRCDDQSTGSGQGFDVIGISFPGVPGFSHQGHNGRVAWSVTHAQSDYQDLYIERLDPLNPERYAYRGTWRDAEVSEEQIKVKGERPVVERVRRTLHGPIVENGPWPQHALALRYVGLEPGKTFECFLPMMRARTCAEFKTAQREWVDPGQCLVFADVEGSIGMLMRGRLPIRSPANAWLPVPGWSGEHEWQGAVPFEQLPQVSNPPVHYIVTANQKVAADDYLYHITHDAGAGYRALRIAERLGPLVQATVADFADIQADRLSIPARELVPLLLSVESGDAEVRRAQESLRGWDYRMDAESVAASIYTVTRDRLMRLWLDPLLGQALTTEMLSGGRGAGAQLGRLRSRLARLIQTRDARLLDLGEQAHRSWSALMVTAVQEAMRDLRAALGPDEGAWQWARLHRTRLRHPLAGLSEAGDSLNPPQVACGCDGDTVQNAGYAPALGFAVTGTAVYRQIVDLGDIAHSCWVVPLGASGHPGSPHFADQVEVWRAGGHIPMLYDWSEVHEHAETELTLDADGRPAM